MKIQPFLEYFEKFSLFKINEDRRKADYEAIKSIFESIANDGLERSKLQSVAGALQNFQRVPDSVEAYLSSNPDLLKVKRTGGHHSEVHRIVIGAAERDPELLKNMDSETKDVFFRLVDALHDQNKIAFDQNNKLLVDTNFMASFRGAIRSFGIQKTVKEALLDFNNFIEANEGKIKSTQAVDVGKIGKTPENPETLIKGLSLNSLIVLKTLIKHDINKPVIPVDELTRKSSSLQEINAKRAFEEMEEYGILTYKSGNLHLTDGFPQLAKNYVDYFKQYHSEPRLKYNLVKMVKSEVLNQLIDLVYKKYKSTVSKILRIPDDTPSEQHPLDRYKQFLDVRSMRHPLANVLGHMIYTVISPLTKRFTPTPKQVEAVSNELKEFEMTVDTE